MCQHLLITKCISAEDIPQSTKHFCYVISNMTMLPTSLTAAKCLTSYLRINWLTLSGRLCSSNSPGNERIEYKLDQFTLPMELTIFLFKY